MDSNQGYKNRALNSLEGKWSTAVITTFVFLALYEGVTWVVTTPMGDDLMLSYSTQGVWSLVCLPLAWGFCVFFLNLIRNEDIKLEHLFDGYKDFIRVFLAEFLCLLAVTIGVIFLIVPGIILGLMFSQTNFILKDDKEIGVLEAMKQSVAMMKGYKVRLFWLWLSFIGWFILAILTLGFGNLLLAPYFNTTLAHFYEDLKAQQGLNDL